MRKSTLVIATALIAAATTATAERDDLEFDGLALNQPLTAGADKSEIDQTIVSRNVFGGDIGRSDWTGFYVGGQLGYAGVDTDISDSSDEFIGGFFGGYDYDLGQWVIGGSLDYDFTDADVAGGIAEVENIFRVKARGGYKFGNNLFYGTAGYALAETDNLGSDDGYFVGVGYEYLVNSNFSIGTEVLYHEFNNFNSTDVDVEATTVQIRGTFRF